MSNAMIRVMCPNLKCRRILAVPVSARGKTVRCSHCRANVRIPVPPVAPVPVPAAPDAGPQDNTESTIDK